MYANATAGVMALLFLMAGCRSSEELPAQASTTTATTTATTIKAVADGPVAPVANTLRKGGWRGGPDPVSGKLRSGIATYYRLDPAQPKAGQTVQVDLRFEDVVGSDATVKLTVGDGAQWVAAGNTGDTTVTAGTAWRLSQNQASQVTVRITVPAGDSYLHVMTAQNNRPSVTSILLSAL